MIDKNLNPWKLDLIREVSLRRLILLSGNVRDKFRIEESGDTVKLTNYLDILLKKNSSSNTGKDNLFDEVIVWDNISKVRECNRATIGKIMTNSIQVESDGDYYDMGDDDTEDNKTCNIGTLQEYISLIFAAMSNGLQQKIAFIVDLGDYLFTNNQNLSDIDMNILNTLDKITELSDDKVNGSTIIFISKNSTALSSLLTRDNSKITEVKISIPNKFDRLTLIKDNLYKLRLTDIDEDKQSHEEINEKLEIFSDKLDGMTLIDIENMIKLSRNEHNLSSDKLLSLYRYGIKNNPWSELNPDRIRNIDKILMKRVIGQNDAIFKVKNTVISAYTGFTGFGDISKQNKPKGILFFVGPTGVGKTELAKALAEFLFGDESSYLRFDMSEYNSEHSDQRLIGAPPGYVGYEEGGQLTNAIKEKPFSVILFDEIEKAHGKILDKFLQILEDGRLTDGKGDTVNFNQCVIIFTSNIGAAHMDLSKEDKEIQHDFIRQVKDFFINKLERPEILNRIGDNIVPFNPIRKEEDILNIINSKLNNAFKVIEDTYKLKIIIDNLDDVGKLILRNVDISNGGRGILNTMDTKLKDVVNQCLFDYGDSKENSAFKINTIGNHFYLDKVEGSDRY